MKSRLLLTLLAAAVLLVCAFSTGGAGFLLGAVLLLAAVLYALISVRWAAGTLEVSCSLSDSHVRRGEDVTLTVSVRHSGRLPVAPMLLTLQTTPELPATQVRLRDVPGKQQRLTLPFHAAHVGVCHPGVTACTVEDLFSLFSVTREPKALGGELLVYPMPFETEELEFAPGDPGSETMARATEDISSPADVRPYREGDSLKKVHWKLSARKGEIMVRRFEEPVLSEALVLMDCSAPPAWGHPEAGADIRDSLLETAASVVISQMRTDHGVRLPLLGSHPVEIEKSMGIPLLLEELARMDFSETDRFERVLQLETRRIRKVGATVVIAARLSGNMADVMVRMRRMGPTLRFYLVTFMPDDPQMSGLIGKLQQAGIEVRFVTPAQG